VTGNEPSLDAPLAASKSVISSASAAPSAASAAPVPVRVPPSWTAAVRAGDWAAARQALEGLPAPQRDEPLTRYIRARAALEIGDAGSALSLLADLEQPLPTLKPEIERTRAHAALALGRYAEAHGYFAGRSEPRDRLKLALILQETNQREEARRVLDALLGKRPKQPTTLEAEIRAARARYFEKLERPAQAALEQRWLAIEAPTSPFSARAAEELARLAPQLALSRDARLERARAFADAGDPTRTEEEIAAASALPGAPLDELAVLRLRGMARYVARRELREGAEALARAAALSGASQDAFLAARALGRLGALKEAVGRYDALIAKLRSARNPGPWLERARFEAARLEYVLGNWGAALERYDEYLARHPRGTRRGSADYERSVAALAAGQGERAEKAFARLLKDAEPSQYTRARLRNLRALALLGQGNTDGARREWRAVLEEYPLTLAAHFARARLDSLGEAPSPSAPLPWGSEAPARDPGWPERARLFHAVGLDDDAERELVGEEARVRAHAGTRAIEALCGWYAPLGVARRRFAFGRPLEPALRPPSEVNRWAWSCAYPEPYPELVRAEELKNGLPALLLYAVMRQESAFRPDARSPADALGLLQLLPSTAARVAAELGLRPEDLTRDAISTLSLPQRNVPLGARYLARLLARFNQHLLLSLAAYNAGPQAVSSWLEGGERLPLDLFLARIPFEETREYVERVGTNLIRYRARHPEFGELALPGLELPLGLRAAPDDY
jgi:soluble lytic murein transglycosylase